MDAWGRDGIGQAAAETAEDQGDLGDQVEAALEGHVDPS